jgi:hypothetical protein
LAALKKPTVAGLLGHPVRYNSRTANKDEACTNCQQQERLRKDITKQVSERLVVTKAMAVRFKITPKRWSNRCQIRQQLSEIIERTAEIHEEATNESASLSFYHTQLPLLTLDQLILIVMNCFK